MQQWESIEPPLMTIRWTPMAADRIGTLGVMQYWICLSINVPTISTVHFLILRWQMLMLIGCRLAWMAHSGHNQELRWDQVKSLDK